MSFPRRRESIRIDPVSNQMDPRLRGDDEKLRYAPLAQPAAHLRVHVRVVQQLEVIHRAEAVGVLEREFDAAAAAAAERAAFAHKQVADQATHRMPRVSMSKH